MCCDKTIVIEMLLDVVLNEDPCHNALVSAIAAPSAYSNFEKSFKLPFPSFTQASSNANIICLAF